MKGWALACLALITGLAGVGAIFFGLRATGSTPGVVLDATPATAPATPSTVPTSAPAAVSASPPPTSPPVATTPGPDEPEAAQPANRAAAVRSPLADLLGASWSAIPPTVQPRAVPAGIQIGSIDVSRFPVRPVGLAFDGQLEVPDETEIGWYRHGATAGEPGATVLAAHVSWNGTTGPFARLGAVEPGDPIELRLDDGNLRRYEVVERAVYGKLELPADRIWRRSGDETLVLITCGGEFNPSIRRYQQNIVVYAVPVG